MASVKSQQQMPAGAVDISTLPAPQLQQIQQRLSSELEHLTTSHAKLRAAQNKFRECVRSVGEGVNGMKGDGKEDRDILVPLTSSLYVRGKLADTEKVLVDVGTGFYVEKTTKDAEKFYTKKVEELGTNLKDLEKVVQGKSTNLKIVEDFLRQKILAGEGQGASGQQTSLPSRPAAAG